MTYENVNNFIVIDDDNRDPAVSFQHHRKRRSFGGVDCVAPLGTPIYAPDACILINYPDNGSGGNTIQLNYMSGAIDQMMHLSSFVESGHKAKGQLVGYSGDTGSPGQPHVHWHRLGAWRTDAWGETNRYNPWDYFETEGHNDTETEQQEEDEMNYIYWTDSSTGEQRNAVFNPISGFFGEFQSSDGSYNTGIAALYGVATTITGVTESHAQAIKNDCSNVRTGSK